jgi:hypothetical protein
MTLRNFFVHPHGSASNRSGTQYRAHAKNGDKKARVVPFEFSTEQAYVIEFGEYYCRFYMNGGQIIAPTDTAAWITATVYYIGDFVKVSSVIYRSKTNHTSNGTDHNTPPGNTTDWEASEIYEIATPYDQYDLEDLQFVQSADVLYITHSDFYPRTLTRYSHISWRLETYPFEKGPFMSQNATTTTITPSAVTGSITLTASAAVFNILHIGALFKLEHAVEGQAYSGAFSGTGTGTALKCGGTWRLITHGTWTAKIKVEKSINGGSTWTAVRVFSSAADYNPNTYGEEDEELPFLVRINCYSYTSGTVNVDLTTDGFTQSGIVKITSYSSPTSVGATVLVELGTTAVTADWYEGSWSDYRGYPAAATFYQDRLVFASSRTEPHTVWTTKTSNYINFDRSTPLVDSDGITVNLPSRKMNAVRNLVSLGEILAFTSSSEWSIGPASSAAITPTSVDQKCQGYRGSSKVSPIVIGNRVIFIQPKGSIVRDLVYDFGSNSYDGDPLSLLSNHLFQNHEIIDMAYQAEPDSLLWCIRDDGILLSLTYLREQEVIAWTWHDTDGEFESVCCIPGDTYDEVWFVVKRGTSRFIERMVQRMVSTDPRDQFFMDCGISYDVHKDITGISLASQAVITATSHGFVNGDLIDIEGVEGILDSDGESLVNSLRFIVSDKTDHTFKIKYADTGSSVTSVSVTAGGTGYAVDDVLTLVEGRGATVTVTGVSSGVITTISLTAGGSGYSVGVKATTGGTGTGATINVLTIGTYINTSAATAYVSGGEARKVQTSFSRLSHLNGKTVVVLANGSVINNLVVADGALTLPVAASIVHIGLPYWSDLQTLNIELPLATGTTQGRKLKIPSVQFSFLNTRGGWIGPDADNLDEFTQRTNEPMGSPIALQTGFYDQPITGNYKEGGRVFFRQKDPLPVTILAVIPTVSIGG